MQNTVAPPPVFTKRRIRGLTMAPKYGGIVVPISAEISSDKEIKVDVINDKFFYGVSQRRIKEYMKSNAGQVWRNKDFRNSFKISHSQANEFGKYLREHTKVLKQGRRRMWLIDKPEVLNLK